MYEFDLIDKQIKYCSYKMLFFFSRKCPPIKEPLRPINFEMDPTNVFIGHIIKFSRSELENKKH